jgi:hypothetical protein
MRLRLNWCRLTICVLVLAWSAVVEACPNCKQALSENGHSLVTGYFWSIVFMMSMPFLLLGGLSTYFYILVVRARTTTLREMPVTASASAAPMSRTP